MLPILSLVLSNVVAALVLAAIAVVVGRTLRRPAVTHGRARAVSEHRGRAGVEQQIERIAIDGNAQTGEPGCVAAAWPILEAERDRRTTERHR